ncbi:major facilitator superfamily domain-containing protein [Nemania sp. NC0429]|nr:major facilitator superfamily domain-containing protein [Nemania sp. NC0429]
MAESERPAIENAGSGGVSPSSPRSPKSVRFWGIIAALSLLSFTCALDVAIITTALPAIISAVGGATEYVWIANSFVVSSSVLQPLFGQVSDLFGRLLPLLTSTALFLLGSGIAGGANGPAMLIGGRTVQGVGAGGLYVLLDIVCCDLVPLRERGKYLGLINSFAALAAALGPVLGGVIAQWNVALAIVLTFMRVKRSAADGGKRKALYRVDYLGNLIFIPGMIAILFGLISGGIDFPWSSWRVILPLGIGLFTLLGNHSSTALWVIFQLLASIGLGITQSTLLPAIMAALPEAHVASATAFYAFVRTFGFVWGVTIASVAFNSLFDANLHIISDASLRDQLRNGAAYAFASRIHQLRSMHPAETLSQVQAVYAMSLRGIWYICLGLSLLGCLVVGLERSLELRRDLDTAYGLEEAEKDEGHGTNSASQNEPIPLSPGVNDEVGHSTATS